MKKISAISKKTKILAAVISCVVIVIVAVIVFIPPVALTPLASSKAALEKYDIAVDGGLYFLSKEYFSEIRDYVESTDYPLNDIYFNHERFEKLAKHNKGAIVSGIVIMELFYGGQDEGWKYAADWVWDFYQDDGKISIHGSEKNTFLELPEGFKTY